MFLNSFYDAVEGFRTDNVVTFRNARGEDVPLRVHEIVERLRIVDSPAAREAAFVSAVADGYPFKVTFPAPSLFGHPFSYKQGVTSGYGSLEEFVAHAIQIERGRVRLGDSRADSSREARGGRARERSLGQRDRYRGGCARPGRREDEAGDELSAGPNV
jgi:hypothetical protein